MGGMTRLNLPMSRRGVLRGGMAATALSLLSSCDAGGSAATTSPTSAAPHTGPAATGSQAGSVPNVRVSGDRYGVHVEPSVALNPRNPRQLLAASQVSPGANPEFLATYL
jgi:hypothetical protein